MTTSSTPDRGRALLMSTAAASFVLSAALVAGPALAANECGAQSGTTVTCTSAGNPYATGITYTPTTDLTVVTDNTVAATGPVTVAGSTSANTASDNAGTVNTVTAATTTTPAGIAVSSDTGNATIDNTGTVTTSATNTPGLFATTGGAGNVSITSTGSVTTTGASTFGGTLGSNSDGVVAVTTGTGSTTVNVTNVSATGAGSWGVLAENIGSGPVSVTVAQGGTVTANGDAVAMLAVPGSTETLYNNGTITAGAGAYSVITAVDGASATIDNMSGATLNGPISLNGGIPGGVGNTVNNAGTWNVSGTSTFGATDTTNVLNNTGTINVAPGVTPATTVNFVNLSTFNNATASLSMTSGNSLNVGNAQFNGGTDSTLRVNANSESGTLFLGSTGTGTTRVVLADIPATNPAMNFKGETLVTGTSAGAGPAFGSFNLGAENDQQAGFVDYRLAFTDATATTSSAYTLYGLPGSAVFEALNIPYALQDFWRHSADAFTQRQMSIRDSLVGQQPTRAEGWEFWAEPYGGEDYFKRPQTYSFGGFEFGSIGNHNDNVGLQVGADLLGHWGPLAYAYWGFTGGIEQQTTTFPGGNDADNLYSVGGNLGLYGGAAWQGFYANAIGKVDWDNMNINLSSANFSPTNTYKAYGTRGEVGYRWPWQGFFVEPSGRVSAIWTDGIDLSPAGGLLNFNDADPVVEAQFGGRVGTTFNFGMFFPHQVNPFPGVFNLYVGAWYEDQYAGRNRMDFTTVGGLSSTTIDLAQLHTGTFTHMEYGLETADWYGGLKLFLKGENDFDGRQRRRLGRAGRRALLLLRPIQTTAGPARSGPVPFQPTNLSATPLLQ